MPATIPFVRDMDFKHGVLEPAAPGLRRMVAPNGGDFTFHGTATFVIGEGRVCVVDPGPDLDDHVEALIGALAGETVTHILVTHTHMDHSPACRPLQAATRAPTYGFGPHGAGKLEAEVEVEAGGDMDFVPDHAVRHGEVIAGDGWSMECVHTPGHTSNHICYAWRETGALLSGDHVMGWSTTIVSPPDGDMDDYMASLDLLLGRDDARYWPTHGPPIKAPKPYVRALIAHREEREAQILECLGRGLDTIGAMVSVMYGGQVPAHMFPAAARSVFATVIRLVNQRRVACRDELAVDARYAPGGD